MTTTLTPAGLIEIPEVFRKADDLQPGQRCDIERVGRGEYRVSVAEETPPPPTSWVDWLLACPEKGWFHEPDRTEMTSLKPPALFAE